MISLQDVLAEIYGYRRFPDHPFCGALRITQEQEGIEIIAGFGVTSVGQAVQSYHDKPSSRGAPDDASEGGRGRRRSAAAAKPPAIKLIAKQTSCPPNR